MALDTYEDGGKARRKDADQTQLNDSQSKTEHDKHLSLNIRDSKHTFTTALFGAVGLKAAPGSKRGTSFLQSRYFVFTTIALQTAIRNISQKCILN
jgi:hypothetical protein